MKTSEVVVGEVYLCRISGNVVQVKVLSETTIVKPKRNRFSGLIEFFDTKPFLVQNLFTEKQVKKTASMLRRRVV